VCNIAHFLKYGSRKCHIGNLLAAAPKLYVVKLGCAPPGRYIVAARLFHRFTAVVHASAVPIPSVPLRAGPSKNATGFGNQIPTLVSPKGGETSVGYSGLRLKKSERNKKVMERIPQRPSVAKANAEVREGYRSGEPLRHPKAKSKTDFSAGSHA
jgi:hypothetical protein